MLLLAENRDMFRIYSRYTIQGKAIAAASSFVRIRSDNRDATAAGLFYLPTHQGSTIPLAGRDQLDWRRSR